MRKHFQEGVDREVTLERVHDNYKPMEDFCYLALLHAPSEPGAPATLQLDGAILNRLEGASPEELARRLSENEENAWYYNENLRISFVKLFDGDAKRVVRMQ